MLYEEVAFVAYHFHWPPEAIVNLEHGDREMGERDFSDQPKNQQRAQR